MTDTTTPGMTGEEVDFAGAAVEEWQTRFYDLYRAVSHANQYADSLNISSVLKSYNWEYTIAEKALDGETF